MKHKKKQPRDIDIQALPLGKENSQFPSIWLIHHLNLSKIKPPSNQKGGLTKMMFVPETFKQLQFRTRSDKEIWLQNA